MLIPSPKRFFQNGVQGLKIFFLRYCKGFMSSNTKFLKWLYVCLEWFIIYGLPLSLPESTFLLIGPKLQYFTVSPADWDTSNLALAYIPAFGNHVFTWFRTLSALKFYNPSLGKDQTHLKGINCTSLFPNKTKVT